MKQFTNRMIDDCWLRANERFIVWQRNFESNLTQQDAETSMGLAWKALRPDVKEQLRMRNPADYQVVADRFGG